MSDEVASGARESRYKCAWYRVGLSCFSFLPAQKRKGRRNVRVVKGMFQFQPPTLVYLPLPGGEPGSSLGSGKREVGGHSPRLLCLPSLETFYYRKGRLQNQTSPEGNS